MMQFDRIFDTFRVWGAAAGTPNGLYTSRVQTATPPAVGLPLIDIGKALASQLIIWHHLALYGPMSDVAAPLLGGLLVWLVDYGRLAVQVFLVIGGFLAARSLLPAPGAPAKVTPCRVPSLLFKRLKRLMPTYWLAVMAAIWCAWCARSLIDYPTIPLAPTWWQLGVNAVMLQDVFEENALSAGLWYVAIDFQLYALLVLLCAARTVLLPQGPSKMAARVRAWGTALGVLALMGLSLYWFNRNSRLDVWGIYFFGSYAMGVLAQWAHRRGRLGLWGGVMLLLSALALWLEWRSRIAVAVATAGALALLASRGQRLTQRPVWPRIAWLSRISYGVFLLHYPISLLVGAVCYRLWPEVPEMHLLGLGLTWLLSLWVGSALYWVLEAEPAPAVAPTPAMPVFTAPATEWAPGWAAQPLAPSTFSAQTVLPQGALASLTPSMDYKVLAYRAEGVSALPLWYADGRLPKQL